MNNNIHTKFRKLLHPRLHFNNKKERRNKKKRTKISTTTQFHIHVSNPPRKNTVRPSIPHIPRAPARNREPGFLARLVASAIALPVFTPLYSAAKMARGPWKAGDTRNSSRAGMYVILLLPSREGVSSSSSGTFGGTGLAVGAVGWEKVFGLRYSSNWWWVCKGVDGVDIDLKLGFPALEVYRPRSKAWSCLYFFKIRVLEFLSRVGRERKLYSSYYDHLSFCW